MARQKSTVSIDGLSYEVEVYELKVKDIQGIFGMWFEAGDLSTDKLLSKIPDILPKCTSLRIDDIPNLAPSELKTLWDEFQKVNSVFFGLARQVGIGEFLERFKVQLVDWFSAEFSISLDTALVTPKS